MRGHSFPHLADRSPTDHSLQTVDMIRMNVSDDQQIDVVDTEESELLIEECRIRTAIDQHRERTTEYERCIALSDVQKHHRRSLDRAAETRHD